MNFLDNRKVLDDTSSRYYANMQISKWFRYNGLLMRIIAIVFWSLLHKTQDSVPGFYKNFSPLKFVGKFNRLS